MSKQSELQSVAPMFNESICEAMLKFFKTQPGRLTPDRADEFKKYVLKEVSDSACYFMVTALDMMGKSEISKYVNNLSGKFYRGYYKAGKQNLAKILKEHLSSSDLLMTDPQIAASRCCKE